MKRPPARLAAACALAAATALLTGTALADPGNGNSANAPGQQNQPPAAQPAPAQPATQAAPTQQATPPGQAKKAAPAPSAPSTHAATQSPGQAKKAAQSTAPTSSQAGVKPSSTTKHWTHTTVGASPDVSKRYGNGKTAAQIAHSRGAPDSQPLTGPGNSQPHKTYDCRHKNNHSGGVDVHAIKSYDTTSCTAQVQQVQPQTSVTQTQVCGATTITSSSTQVVGVLHGKNEHLMTNTHSAHFTKHGDTPVTATVTQTQVVPTGENCTTQTQAPSVLQTQQSTPQQSAQQASTSNSTSASGALPATQAAPVAPAAAGGVLGAHTTLASPKPAHHGVLGTVTHVAGASLPFTGFPVWVAVLIALALIAGGLLLRRRSADARI